MLVCCYFESPVGPLLLAGDDVALWHLRFAEVGRPAVPEQDWNTSAAQGPLLAATRQLREYFQGRRTVFDLPLRPEGTAFQRNVWRTLEQIPYGATISYAELARRVGNPKAARAVGSANGRNPLAIVIPCHRVIAADGGLGGFGGGLQVKQQLLDLEQQR
jgi:methylated-DNA-[protein]-cysteine S-methyltransferase